MQYDDVASDPFMNPSWVQYMTCVAKKEYTLMPYRSTRETLGILRRKPGLIFRYGNGTQNVSRLMGGITSYVKLVEVIGEVVNDATPAGGGGPLVVTSPVVCLMEYKTVYESALPSTFPANYVVGDGAQSTVTSALTGQPWNYMFPTPSSSSSLGTSVVVSALANGI